MPWPGGVVRYYNAAPSQGWALWQAVAAWNRSGARVRFVATSRRNAQLIVRHDPSVASCKKASATIGFVRRATVKIHPLNGTSESCNKYAAARFLAHELGHVLGLQHEDGGCAAMNSSGWYGGGAMCEPGNRWEWRCQLLELDDIRGVVAIYGGRVAASRRRQSPMCPLYNAIAAPSALSASYSAEHGRVLLAFDRAVEPLAPPFLAGRGHSGYAYLGRRGTCPDRAMFTTASRQPWAGGRDGSSQLVDQPAPGNHCYSVWSIDALGRPSARAATAWVLIPPTPP